MEMPFDVPRCNRELRLNSQTSKNGLCSKACWKLWFFNFAFSLHWFDHKCVTSSSDQTF